MALVYDFAFGATCAGLDAVVTEVYTGAEVDGSPVTLDAAGSAQLQLTQGAYSGVVAGSARQGVQFGDITTIGVLDQAATDAGGGGDTPAASSDSSGVSASLTVSTSGEDLVGAWGENDGPYPDWMSVTDGVITIVDAGVYSFTLSLGPSGSADTPSTGGIYAVLRLPVAAANVNAYLPAGATFPDNPIQGTAGTTYYLPADSDLRVDVHGIGLSATFPAFVEVDIARVRPGAV